MGQVRACGMCRGMDSVGEWLCANCKRPAVPAGELIIRRHSSGCPSQYAVGRCDFCGDYGLRPSLEDTGEANA